MTSEIRTNSLKSRAGLSTVTFTDSGPMFSGITTFVDNSGFNIGTGSSIFSPATNTFTLGTNSAERLRIDSNGNIGVGIVPSSGARLQIVSNDNPFVGTRYNAGADGSVLFLQHSRSNTIGAGAALNDNDEIGTVQFRAFASDNSSIKNAAFVKAEVNGTTGSAGVPADLIFGTGTSSGNATERFRIDSSGRVMIGTTTEGESTLDDLTIATSGDTGITIRSGTSSNGAIGFSDGTSGADEYRGIIDYDHNGDFLRFYTNATEKLRISSSGKVGIDMTNPDAYDKFVVSGTGNVISARATSGAAGLGFYENNTGRFFIKSLNGSDGISFVDADNSSERLRIDSSGNVTINTGNLTIPDSIIHSGDTNTKIRFPAADTISMEVAGSEVFKIVPDAAHGSSQSIRLRTTHTIDGAAVNMGGTKAYSAGIIRGLVNIRDGNAYNVTDNGGGLGFSAIYNNGGSHTTMSQIEGVKANNTDGNYEGAIKFSTRHNLGNMVEKARIGLNGLSFQGDTAAANCLDDYEEGSWTPAVAFDVGGGSISYGSRAGSYVKIGRMVHLQYYMVISSGVSSSDYFARLALPFTGISVQHQDARIRQWNSGNSDWFVSLGGANPVFFKNNATGGGGVWARGDSVNGHILSGQYTLYI